MGIVLSALRMMVTQTQLMSGTTVLTAYLEDKFEVGQYVTLKNTDDPDRRWRVVDKFASTELSSINRGWNNNI